MIEFGGYITAETARKARELLLDPERTAELCQRNYEIARRHYSCANLERLLAALLATIAGG